MLKHDKQQRRRAEAGEKPFFTRLDAVKDDVGKESRAAEERLRTSVKSLVKSA